MQVENGAEDFGWECVVNFQRKSQSKVNNSTFSVTGIQVYWY